MTTFEQVEERKKARLTFERELWNAGIPPDRTARYVDPLFARLEKGEPRADLVAEAVAAHEGLEERVEKLRRSPRGRRMASEF